MSAVHVTHYWPGTVVTIYSQFRRPLLAMDNTPPETHIHEWDESDVHSWLASIGYPQYEAQIRGLVLYVPCNTPVTHLCPRTQDIR
jgi:hypothetical protein